MKIINPSTHLYVNGQPLAWKYGIDMLEVHEASRLADIADEIADWADKVEDDCK
jgi:hypothetical protein